MKSFFKSFLALSCFLLITACTVTTSSVGTSTSSRSPLAEINSTLTNNNIDELNNEIVKALTGIDLNDIFSDVLAEPENSPFIYFYEGNGINIYQYNKNTKKFTKMPWQVMPQGGFDILSSNQHFMLGLADPDVNSEVRTLRLTDLFHGTQKNIEKLVSPNTYTQLISEFDGAARGMIYESNNRFSVEVYLDNPPVSVSTINRNAIASKVIEPSKY